MIERSLELEASLESIRPLGLWLHAAAQALELPYEVAFALDLAVHEAVENVVRHGRREEPGGRVRVSLRRDGRSVEVMIEDDGVPFDPLQAPAPPVLERIEDVIPGGRGIQLMRHFTDEIRYRHEEGRNFLTLRRALTSRDGAA